MTTDSPKPAAPPAETTLTPTEARGGQRVGLIWMLVISTALAAIALLGFWAINSHHMNSAQASTDASKASAAATFNTPAPPSPDPSSK